MAARPWHSRVKIEGVVLGAGVDLGIEEAHEDQQTFNKRHTWRGRGKIFGPRHLDLPVITLTCTDRLAPGWEHLRVRDAISYHSSRDEGVTIPAGLASVVLRYFPAPDPTRPSGHAVFAEREDTGEAVPLTLVGKTVSVAPIPGVAIKVNYRPIYPCAVLGKNRGTATEIEGKQSWGLVLMVLA